MAKVTLVTMFLQVPVRLSISPFTYVRCTADAVDGQARAFNGFEAGAMITLPPINALADAGAAPMTARLKPAEIIESFSMCRLLLMAQF